MQETLAHWLGDLLADLEDGLQPDLAALARAACELRERADEQSEYYAQEAPLEGEPVRAHMAEMAELLGQAADHLAAYVETSDLDRLRQAAAQAQELCDLREALHYDLQGESDRDSSFASY